jgi:hypothetical protein
MPLLLDMLIFPLKRYRCHCADVAKFFIANLTADEDWDAALQVATMCFISPPRKLLAKRPA